ncbi:hypothetical protein E2C01_043199 [Portunus trituberculatus]|uniref:Uncharacterized protein n=1 Tax=Portunus trituberculatus TaxID=210409 RepID=A0A5B7FNU4_PORTR|nr:hypothetical protein [Portunus trituberculatus]
MAGVLLGSRASLRAEHRGSAQLRVLKCSSKLSSTTYCRLEACVCRPHSPIRAPSTLFRPSCIMLRPRHLDVLPPPLAPGGPISPPAAGITGWDIAPLAGVGEQWLLLHDSGRSDDITRRSRQDFEPSLRGAEAPPSILYEQLFTVIERNYVASPLLDICITGNDRTPFTLCSVSVWFRLPRGRSASCRRGGTREHYYFTSRASLPIQHGCYSVPVITARRVDCPSPAKG